MSIKRFEPQNILITRLSAIGDCILTIPLAVRARQLWPNACIYWAVECAAAQLLEAHPAIDQIVKVPRGWLKKPGKWRSLKNELRSLNCDLVLDPQGLTKSSALGWISGAKLRVGFDRTHAREIAPWLANVKVSRSEMHMVDAYCQLLSPWTSFEAGSAEFAMPEFAAAAQSVAEWLRHARLTPGWIAVNPGAGWSTRLWPVERFAATVQQVHHQTGRTALILWG